MPAEKQTKLNTSKPVTPTLSSNFRNVKSPLTYRAAGASASSPNLSGKQPFVRSKSPSKPDQLGTPLNGNITPRSGTRKSRTGTESPLTPAQPRVLNGTRSRATSGNETQKPVAPVQGLGMISPRPLASTPTLAKVGSPFPTPVVTVHRRVSAAKSMVEDNKDISSKFFRADEAKSAIGSPGLEEKLQSPVNASHFFVGSPPSPTSKDVVIEGPSLDGKFFRAADIPSQKRTGFPPVPPVRLSTPPIATGRQESRPTPQSPVNSHPSPQVPISPRKYTPSPTTSPSVPRTTAARPKSTASNISAIQTSTQRHRKSISASSITSSPIRKLSGPRGQPPPPLDIQSAPIISPRVPPSNVLSPETLSPRSISLTSTNTIATSVTSDTELSEVAIPAVVPTTSLDPASIVQPQVDQATTARRERKVLDLEISNSSLLAINKTLERELRKQSTELRRYRRLSRSGRLSVAPTTRTVSGQSNFSLDTVTEIDVEDHQLSDYGENTDLDDPDDEDGSLLSNESSSVTSPSARSRQRVGDEKRLMRDLSRHQQVLIDSQKLSQSIKRCLTCTETLLRDGNKALDYRVGIGDVKLGGRVLNDDELDERGLDHANEEPEARQGLLSPSIAKANLDQNQLWPIIDQPPTIEDRKELAGFTSLDELTDMLEDVSAELDNL